MVTNNAGNVKSTGLESLTSGGVINGRTLVGGTGIVITNPDGTTGNPILSQTTFNPNSIISIYDDFLPCNSNTSGVLKNYLGWGTESGIQGTNTITSGNPGQLRIGGNGTGVFSFSPGVMTKLILGGGAITLNWIMKLNALAAGDYIICFGFANTNSTVSPLNGVFFKYTNTVNSGNYTINCGDGTLSTTNTTTAATTTGFHNFQISINAAGSSVQFFIDGVSQGTIATHIPTVNIAPMFTYSATNVSGTNNAVIDFFSFKQILTTPR